MASQDVSPLKQQYMDIKRQHEDCILFFRLGDFYEMFYDDAKTASAELEIALTGKNFGQDERAPMCGVPYHSCEAYIARLIARGYKVAICEQTEDQAKAKGLVTREVIRVVTPGTVTESAMLPEAANNYLCAAYADSLGAGICFCDLSTGEVYATALTADESLPEALLEECQRFEPREAILSDGVHSLPGLADHLRERLSCRVEAGGEWRFLEQEAQGRVESQLDPGGGAEALLQTPCALRAVGGLLSYLQETQKNSLGHIRRVELYQREAFMGLDSGVRRNLELFETLRGREKRGSLLWVLSHTRTAMGGRCLRQWMEKPLLNPLTIRRRLLAVDCLCRETLAREELIRALSGMSDLERLIGRVALGTANARDLRAIAAAAEKLPAVRAVSAGLDSELLRSLTEDVDELQDIRGLVEAAIVDEPPLGLKDGGLIRPGYDAEADSLRDAMENGRGLLTRLESRLREETGIRSLKVGFNKVFGYYIEVTRANMAQVPSHFIRKQTLAGGERYINEELKELENRVLGAQERITGLEYELFCRVREQVNAAMHRVQRTARALAQLDVLTNFAALAVRNEYVMPDVDRGDALVITEGRHPVVEQMLGRRAFVPNDTRLDCADHRLAVITGPNMAGKSTYMRQTALIVYMAQIGCFVPARQAVLGIVDRVFTRIGAADDLAAGQSTFMVEMREVADIIKNATPRSLIILDEIGRGTSTYDGMSIARAVLEYCADRRRLGAKTMFATHYHELTELSQVLEGVRNYATAVKKRGDDITFLRRIVPGGADDSYGIEVAKLAGVPQPIIRRAKEILQTLEDGAPVRAVGKAPRPEAQASLADFGATELVGRIRELALDELTPMQALNLLYELKTIASRLP